MEGENQPSDAANKDDLFLEEALELVPVLNVEPNDVLQVLPISTGTSPLQAVPTVTKLVKDPETATPGVTRPNAIKPGSSESVVASETTLDGIAESVLNHGPGWFNWTAVPSWAISMVVHVGILFILAAFSIEPMQQAISILQASVGEPQDSLQNFDLQGPPEVIDTPISNDPIEPSAPSISSEFAMPEITTAAIAPTASAIGSVSLNAVTESVLPSSMLSSTMSRVSASLNSRSTGMKSELLERFGGNSASEKSVANALKWISQHQAPNGGWSFAHSRFCRGQCKDDGSKAEAVNGATAMALLPFFGAGQTHLQGQYKDTVKRGLAFLINNMQVTQADLPRGSWHEAGGNMYSHGLAAITVCEAYAMTRDPDLLQPAQLSLNYLAYAQDPRGGGWRYGPHEPGDTSVVGWCLMALKSGSMGNLAVPQSTFRGASYFLDSVSTNNGAYYGYDRPTPRTEGRQATIAIGLLCRMYLGWPKENPGLKEGVEFLSKTGPNPDDLYYSYYGTQVLRHYGGEKWTAWNAKMRDALIKAQVADGHAMGSWYVEGGHGKDDSRGVLPTHAALQRKIFR
jgi:hypothetical protein